MTNGAFSGGGLNEVEIQIEVRDDIKVGQRTLLVVTADLSCGRVMMVAFACECNVLTATGRVCRVTS